MNPARSITIDALPLLGKGGISNYVRPLVEEVLKLSANPARFELFFRLGFRGYRRPAYMERCKALGKTGATLANTNFPDRLVKWLWEAGFNLPKYAAQQNTGIFLATTELVPRAARGSIGWIVYDLSPAQIPNLLGVNAKAYLAQMKARAARTAFIVAISETTRRDIIELLGYPEERVTVVYPGVTLPTARPEDPGMKTPYILYMGALALNKNVDGMLRIYAKCVHEFRLEHKMVLCGKDFCGQEFWQTLTRELGIEDRVTFTGWISEEKREGLLTHASMLWQFSWYEGFGLPVLEAAARGVPVLYTNRGAVKEVIASSEQEIDPADETKAALMAIRALGDENMLRKWAARGRERAARFSWQASAARLLDVLNRQH